MNQISRRVYSPEAVREMLVRSGAEQHGHFRLTSGLHSDTYIDKDSVSAHTEIMSHLCFDIATRFGNLDIDTFVGPAYGAIVAAHVVAQHMNHIAGNDRVKAVFAVKKDDGSFEIRRSMVRHVAGRNCAIIEDILSTGGSARKNVDATLAAGAKRIVGLAAFCNRGGVTRADLGLWEGAAFECLLVLEGVPKYTPEECPLCKKGVPISQEFGHGPIT